uniref:Protein kinase domain-containing protein n=1 Tax=Fagus sylvatica TaxID=28930 RepID=A0A2N9IF61_FAGSY
MNLLWFQTTTAASALGNETDRLVLLKIKEFITNDPHDVMSSWNDSIPFCNWHGVTCSLQHQRVTTLNLEGNNLVGSISPYIGNLTLLRFIYLQNNSFSGNIPQQVGRLFRLQHLNLTRNIFGGEIPVNWSSCSELKIVDFKVNSLIGQIPTELGYLAKLVVLNLGVNNLTGGIPLSLGNLSSLTGLSVAFNNIAGKIPDEIGRLKRLSIFTTSSNKLTGITLPNLQRFGIGINEFSGPIPTSLSNASQLQIFDISDNNFEGLVPTNLGNLQDLLWLGEVPTKAVFQNSSAISIIGNSGLCGGVPEMQLLACPIQVTKQGKNRNSNGKSSSFSSIDIQPNVSFKSLYQATGVFSPSNLIGSGSFGSVYKGILDEEERVVAVKWSRFKALVFEFMTNGSLERWLHPLEDSENQSTDFSLLQRLNIVIDVAYALHYLHNLCEQPIIHCDLKPSNVLDNDMIAHVSDYGLARILTSHK